jgi:hypothetical protein
LRQMTYEERKGHIPEADERPGAQLTQVRAWLEGVELKDPGIVQQLRDRSYRSRARRHLVNITLGVLAVLAGFVISILTFGPSYWLLRIWSLLLDIAMQSPVVLSVFALITAIGVGFLVDSLTKGQSLRRRPANRRRDLGH